MISSDRTSSDTGVTGVSRRRLIKSSLLLLGSVSAGGLFAACSAPSAPGQPAPAAPAATAPPAVLSSTATAPLPAATAAAKTGGTLVIGMEAEISSLDPAVMNGASTFRPMSSLFGMLVNQFDQSGAIQPDLADSWQVAPDGLSVTMNLRPGVKFHDGTDLNADAVVFSFERMLNKSDPNYYGPYALPGFFYQTYKGSSVIDPLTVKFDLTQPDATFVSALLWNSGAIVSPTAAKAAGKDFQNKPVGTGPFKFVAWQKNVATTMERFDGYWRGAPKLDRLVWKPIAEEAARFNQLASGDVDFIVSLDPQFIPQVQANPNLKLIQNPSLHTWFVYLNTHEDHLKDVRVRQALNYGVDVDGIIKNVLKGTALRSTGWAWPNTWSHDPSVMAYAYSPDQAKGLLAEAGYPNGFDLDYLVPESGSGMVAPKEIATAMQADLKKIGVNLKITTMEWVSYLAATGKGLDNVQGRKFGMAQDSWMLPVDDPGIYAEFLTGANSGGYYSNPKYSDLLATGRATLDMDARATAYKDAQKIFAADAPWIFMFHANYVTAARKNIDGLVINANQGLLHLTGVSKA